jgi:aryl-alcohol dehydrogenase-like predicted oxidoreductase
VANRTGQPSFDEICRILQEAYDQGIDTLDTAAVYGQSEELIGKALRRTGLADRIRVVTKVEELPAALESAEASARIETTVRRSIQLLGLDHLELCLFHAQENLGYAEHLLALQARGLVAAAGVSIVNPDGLRQARAQPGIEAVQLPSNLLDRRFTASGLAASARAVGLTIFARSVYLQGLLLMDEARLPDHLREVISIRRPLEAIAAGAGITFGEMAFRAMLGEPGFDSLVVGVDTAEHLRRNLAMVARGPLPADMVKAIAATRVDPPRYLIDPSAWTVGAAGVRP